MVALGTTIWAMGVRAANGVCGKTTRPLNAVTVATLNLY